ncbi:hypothetical protein Q4Q34_09990 [Flavivirga abyssicola]|uniref:hypothetical protein n=1 Tax=Flavivirga abyssicola TaxID=3063533 RepID=UPI0026DFBF93|nr:hypothetical protein [Flavivirga sp. MEBiC07777]WVK11556.1 hypothetical protein Q4Q34_09990 [Flavivirga sp. MEBiC07777]
MKRLKFRPIVKIGILLFGLSTVLWNCQEEHTNQSNSDLENKNKSYDQISLDELLSQTASSKKDLSIKSKKQIRASKKQRNQPVYKITNINGLKYVDDDLTTYVFGMVKYGESPKYYYNLVIRQRNGIINKYIYRYSRDNSEAVTVSKIIDGYTNGKVSSKTASPPICFTQHYYNIIPCPCVGHADPLICRCPIRPTWEYSHSVTRCREDPSDPDIEEPDPNGGGIDIGAGVTYSEIGCIRNAQGYTECAPANPNNDPAEPNEPLPTLEPDSEDYSITTSLDLTNLQRDWLDQLNNTARKSLIETYLNSLALDFVGFSYAKSFAIQVINSWMINPTTVVDFDDKIIIELTGKPLCVYNNLATKNGDLFKQSIGAFVDDPDYHLKFKVGNCSTTNDACTDTSNLDSTGEITITIEDVNQSGLGIAALMLHEGIHAEIHRYVSRFQSGIDPTDRPRLFKLYAFYKGWANSTQDVDYNWKNDAHHQYMVENYVNKIASAVRELDNNKYPLSHYLAYGWEGLTKYGYTAKRLTASENLNNLNLRAIADGNSQICN